MVRVYNFVPTPREFVYPVGMKCSMSWRAKNAYDRILFMDHWMFNDFHREVAMVFFSI